MRRAAYRHPPCIALGLITDLFFFFQAEDGIRYRNVTGVQTCALPISIGNPVRVFPIAYGQDADLPTLKRIAEATNATVYDAADPKSINKVFLAVVSNF